LQRGGGWETVYYHRFYSGETDYCLFMGVDPAVVNADPELHANGVIIPICIVGLLLLFTLEFGIYHLIQDEVRGDEERRGQGEKHAD
jgi:hypothetical protein